MATFYTTYPLLVTLRNTLPGATFYCSGAAVPFSTAEYTNADGNGGGLMGPYVPLVDYVDPNYLPQSAPPTNLPAESSCGVLPSAQPGFNSPTLSNQVDFPNQYWSSTAPATPPNLYCPASQSSASSTAIYFVATQFPTPALTEFGAAACLTQPNSCSQIVVQSPQTSELGNGTWPPPLPLTIVGTGFGVLPQSLPTAVQGSPYLEIHNAEASGGTWDTAATTYCQMYIANWTNTSISLVANLPVGVRDMYSSTVLSPLSDVGPWTFPAAPGCPVASADKLTFTVTNPQSGARVTISSIQVDPAGTTLF
jgi:hypothetical protein